MNIICWLFGHKFDNMPQAKLWKYKYCIRCDYQEINKESKINGK